MEIRTEGVNTPNGFRFLTSNCFSSSTHTGLREPVLRSLVRNRKCRFSVANVTRRRDAHWCSRAQSYPRGVGRISVLPA